MLEADFMEGRCFFMGTFHTRGRFPGRSCVFAGDLPYQRSISRKVGAFSGGPSMPEAVFKEGPAFLPGTIHARDRFQGRSAHFQGDLPCWRLISWKVGAFSWGPSMPEAVFKEGPAFFMGTFHARGDAHERARGERANLAGWRRNPKKRAGEG